VEGNTDLLGSYELKNRFRWFRWWSWQSKDWGDW